jgi:hypothetical protein
MAKSEDDEKIRKQNKITDILLISAGLLFIYFLIINDRLPSNHPLTVILIVTPVLIFLIICIAVIIYFKLKDKKE